MRCFIPISDIEAYSFSFIPYVEDARMYVLRKGNKLLCVDPCVSEEAEKLFADWDVEQCNVLLTHEHYDHTSGVNRLRTLFPCSVLCSQACAALIGDPRRNLSQYAQAQYIFLPPARKAEALRASAPFSCSADETFVGRHAMSWCGHVLTLRETPGHSKGSICVCMDDKVIFTGDSLIPNTKLVTRLPGGSKSEYLRETLPFLRSLRDDLWVLPGHFDGGWLGDLLTGVASCC